MKTGQWKKQKKDSRTTGHSTGQLDNWTTKQTEVAVFKSQKNGTLDAETKELRPIFNANIPQTWWITCLFYAFG